MIEIRFKDIDPDTGSISQDTQIAVCESESSAKWVLHALHKLQEESHDPNREIYTIPETKLWLLTK
jgi:hypothetical protein